MSDNNQRLLALISKVLKIDHGSISDDTSPKNTRSWDSFNALKLFAEIEKEFSVFIQLDEMVAVKCVRDIKNTLARHSINFGD